VVLLHSDAVPAAFTVWRCSSHRSMSRSVSTKHQAAFQWHSSGVDNGLEVILEGVPYVWFRVG
jgi:hypothetical protein